MISLRPLIRPRVLGYVVAAAGALLVIAAWYDYATQSVPVAVAPAVDVRAFDVAAEPATQWSVHLASAEDAAPAPPVGEPLALRLVDAQESSDGWDYRVFAADPRFPVISDDGTIAELFQDTEDFTGAPITTLVAWSPSGKRAASFAIGGANTPDRADSVLRAANTWLARTSWSSLAGTVSVVRSEDHEELQTITPAAGAALVYDYYKGTLTRDGRPIRAKFSSPGGSEFGACGDITGIERAFGSEHLLVLVPSMNLGGDSCFGSPSADVAIAVALR